jgi:hypothetical protein
VFSCSKTTPSLLTHLYLRIVLLIWSSPDYHTHDITQFFRLQAGAEGAHWSPAGAASSNPSSSSRESGENLTFRGESHGWPIMVDGPMIFVNSKFHRITWPKPLHWGAASGKSPACGRAVNCLIKPAPQSLYSRN